MFRRFLSQLFRGGLDRLGYVCYKREFLPYGISSFSDISRLSREWDQPVRTLFDVGANTGQTTQRALAAFPDARIFAFEPHPDTFRKLKQGVSSDRVLLHELALGEQSGRVTLYDYGATEGNSLINSLVPDARYPMRFGNSASERTVECSTIDEFCEAEGIEEINVLKIDTEGFDLSVVRGAKRMLSQHRITFIYTEFNDLQPKNGTTGGALAPIADFLSSFGFRFVATYTDYVVPDGDMFVCANALFALPTAFVPVGAHGNRSQDN